MQSEDMDKKIEEAADHHHPAYDEKAWAGMEKLLDKHLPQKKDDRRRFIFFLLLFLLLGGGAAVLFNQQPGKSEKSIAVKSENKETTSGVKIQADKITDNKPDQLISPVENKNITTGTVQTDAVRNLKDDKPVKLSPRQYQDALQNTFIPKRRLINNPSSVTDKVNTDKGVSRVSANNNPSASDIPVSTVRKPDDEPKSITPGIVTDKTTDIKNEQKLPVETNVQQNDKTEDPKVSNVVKDKKQKSKKTNSFFISLSASPDISAAGGGEYGKMKLLAGAGLGFTFKDRLTIRSGFYSGRKIYSASPDAYNPPASFWANYPYLQKVDADCKVYEIPLLLSYNFENSAKQHWIVSTGISSYLMKRETYNYFYKYTPTGPIHTRQWTITDQNKHLFSVLTFSGGYQRNISKHFFVSAEPYVKIPLTGVGFGKVKLNSAGIQFTIGLKPFGRKSK